MAIYAQVRREKAFVHQPKVFCNLSKLKTTINFL